MKKDLETLKEEYIIAAIDHVVSLQNDDAPGSRKYGKKSNKIFKKIKKAGESGHKLLLELLAFDDRRVNFKAAYHLFFSDTEKAKNIFEELRDSEDDHVSHEAEFMLNMLESGRLKYDEDYFY